MPVMDGLEATRQIRSWESGSGQSAKPIVGLTAHAIQGYKDQCLLTGMDAYACKPFKIEELTAVILRAIAQVKQVAKS